MTPKKKFCTVKELLETHKTSPLKSKARAGAKIFLLHPITASEVQTVINTVKQKQSQDHPPPQSSSLPEPLPSPWKEYFDKNHHRPYFYNPQTRETVWERPKSAKKLLKANTLDSRSSRPLPTIPDGSLNTPRHSLDSGVSLRSPRTLNRLSKPGLPDLPPKSPSSRRHSDIASTNRQLQSKGVSTGIEQQPHAMVPKLPSKDPPSVSVKDVPPLPPKDSSTLPPLPQKIPSKDSSSLPVPSLPPKNPTTDLPPLPPKDPSPISTSLPPLPPKDIHNEYEETVIMPSPNTQRATVVEPLPPPISMNIEPPTASSRPVHGEGPPPPPAPPIPPQGMYYNSSLSVMQKSYNEIFIAKKVNVNTCLHCTWYLKAW